MITLYDAARCPYCARARIYLAEKGVQYDVVEIDLSDRPEWLYEKNPLGKVPVLEEGDVCVPESAVIMELLEERYPEPRLMPVDPLDRALVRLFVWNHDAGFTSAYYAARRGVEGAEERLTRCLEGLDATLASRPYLGGGEYGFADIAWYPWMPRAQAYLDLDFDPYPAVTNWLERLAERPAIAAERDVVAAMATA